MFTGIVSTMGAVASLTPNPFGVRLVIELPNRKLQTANLQLLYHPAPGDSIAVNGVCLTVIAAGGSQRPPLPRGEGRGEGGPPHGAPSSTLASSRRVNPPSASGSDSLETANRKSQTANPPLLSFDIIKETLDKTNLGSLLPGGAVNLEASLRPDTPISGHFVQGHVDGVGSVADIHSGDDESRLTVEVAPDLMPYIVPKGSITLDGVSLTIASVDTAANTFTVALIPTTLNITTLGSVEVGDQLNVETDILARAVVHYLQLHNEQTTSHLTLAKLREAGF